MAASWSSTRSPFAVLTMLVLLSRAECSSTVEASLRGSTTSGSDPETTASGSVDAASGTSLEPAAAVAVDVSSAVSASSSSSVPSFMCGILPEFMKPRSCLDSWTEAAERSSVQAAYSEADALELAYVSTASFCNDWKLQQWDCGVACQHLAGMKDLRRVDNDQLDAHGYVGRLNGQCVLAFRGTDSVLGAAQDLGSLSLQQFPDCSYNGNVCLVGSGFLQNYNVVKEQLKRSLEEIGCSKSSPLAITGHSLGAAMAALAAFDLHRSGYTVSKAYTFGQPRVGDSVFASAFNSALVDVAFFRVTKANDPIVQVPTPGPFHHVGTEVYYSGSASDGYRVCDGSGEDFQCAAKNAGRVMGMLAKCVIPTNCGHGDYMMPLKEGRMGLTSCEKLTIFP